MSGNNSLLFVEQPYENGSRSAAHKVNAYCAYGVVYVAFWSMNSIPNTTINAAIRPMKNAPVAETLLQPAVTATSPAKDPLSVIDTSGFLYFIQVIIITPTVDVAAAIVVVVNIFAALFTEVAAAPLNPYHANQRINTPKRRE